MYSDGDTLSGGLPHSEIPGSTIARISPGLFAACHVLHRLSVPRHPPDALTLRLSATPNGKDQRVSQPIPQAKTDQVRQILLPAKPKASPRFRRSEDTSSRDRSRAAHNTSPHRAWPGAARAAKLRFAGSRYGHTTRFFTIVNQQHAPAANRPPRAIPGSSPRYASLALMAGEPSR